jgi:hypothetical protein
MKKKNAATTLLPEVIFGLIVWFMRSLHHERCEDEVTFFESVAGLNRLIRVSSAPLPFQFSRSRSVKILLNDPDSISPAGLSRRLKLNEPPAYLPPRSLAEKPALLRCPVVIAANARVATIRQNQGRPVVRHKSHFWLLNLGRQPQAFTGSAFGRQRQRSVRADRTGSIRYRDWPQKGREDP